MKCSLDVHYLCNDRFRSLFHFSYCISSLDQVTIPLPLTTERYLICAWLAQKEKKTVKYLKGKFILKWYTYPTSVRNSTFFRSLSCCICFCISSMSRIEWSSNNFLMSRSRNLSVDIIYFLISAVPIFCLAW